MGIATDHGVPASYLRVFSALSDPNRLRIVSLLVEDGVELTCGAISSALGLSPSLLSHHLSVLDDASVIDRRRDGLSTLVRLNRDELGRLIDGLQSFLGSANGANAPASAEPTAS